MSAPPQGAKPSALPEQQEMLPLPTQTQTP